ncbi:MAG TPA: MFS transporter, partial [Thermomicrobiaceae bacterium]|nr:MFS transporter [Thermomicrobiaceae bacterium]
IVICAVGAVILLALFVLVETRAPEPVLPPRLFRNPVFSIASLIGFIVGFAMFGALTYLPLFLQVVEGVSPTLSGIKLLPMMAGLLLTSIGSGQLISRWGRYKVFPIVGGAIMSVGLYLFSLVNERSSTLRTSLSMFVLGFGIGLIMQVLIIAVQNAVAYQDLGVATSGATFFRTIGSSVGVAVFGAVFSNELTQNLARYLPKSGIPADFNPETAEAHPELLKRLPADVYSGYLHAYALSLNRVFEIAVPFGILAFIVAWFLKERPLRQVATATDIGDGFGIPVDRTAFDEIGRALAVLASRETRDRIYRRLAERAGLPLDPLGCWLLFRIEQYPNEGIAALAGHTNVPEIAITRGASELEQAGLISHPAAERSPLALTDDGREAVRRLVEARQQGLEMLLAGWSKEDFSELATLLNRLSRQLLSDGAQGSDIVSGEKAAVVGK